MEDENTLIEQITDELLDQTVPVVSNTAPINLPNDLPPISREQMIETLKKYRHDPNFQHLPIPQSLWCEFPEIIPENHEEYEKINENIALRNELARCKNRKERRKLMRDYLKYKHNERKRKKGELPKPSTN